jgi:hypothetical protein
MFRNCMYEGKSEMSRIIAILLANLFVVDYGLLPDDKDNSVYVIQIEPELVTQLVEGYAIESVIPPEFRGIRKFRIQIGADKLIKPTSLLPATTDDESKPKDVSETEAASIDIDTFPDKVGSPKPSLPEGAALRDLQLSISPTGPNSKPVDQDAFPLRTESEDNQPVEETSLIPERVESAELPGRPVDAVEDKESVQIVLEPDATDLLRLPKIPSNHELSDVVIKSSEGTNESAAEVVGIPVFDNPDSEVATDATADNEQTAQVPLDFLANADAENRIVLVPLPDLVVASDENVPSEATADNEPDLLEDEATKFVRLATVTSGSPKVLPLNPTVKAATIPPIGKRSWPLFSITLLGLLISVGGNIYLGMTILGFYRNSRKPASEMVKLE